MHSGQAPFTNTDATGIRSVGQNCVWGEGIGGAICCWSFISVFRGNSCSHSLFSVGRAHHGLKPSFSPLLGQSTFCRFHYFHPHFKPFSHPFSPSPNEHRPNSGFPWLGLSKLLVPLQILFGLFGAKGLLNCLPQFCHFYSIGDGTVTQTMIDLCGILGSHTFWMGRIRSRQSTCTDKGKWMEELGWMW